VHDTVVPPEEKEYDIGLENVRRMLGWKERLEELSQEAAEATSSKHNLQSKVNKCPNKLYSSIYIFILCVCVCVFSLKPQICDSYVIHYDGNVYPSLALFVFLRFLMNT
jgi:hypothetical protein